MSKQSWFKLDTAGKMYSSIKSSRATTLFRLSADLTELVEPDVLQEALNHVIERFPYFNVNMRRGVFWHYFDRCDHKPLIEEETYFPCMYMRIKKKGVNPFRVLYYKKKISVEFSHSITDGSGAAVFLKSLLYEYFKLKGIEASDEGIFKYGDEPEAGEFEDAFAKYYNEDIPVNLQRKKAFHFPFTKEKKGVYNVVIGIIPVPEILAKSKSYGVSLTEFLCAVYFDAIIELMERNTYKKHPIVLNVPVNVRQMYKTITLRNFFISVTPEIDPRLGKYSFEELLKYMHYFMKITVDEKYINQRIRGSVMSEKNLFFRMVPLFIKDLVMPIVYKVYGEGNYTTGLSNMGRVTMPKELEPYIERFEVYPPPSVGNTIKAAVVSYNDKLYITFGKLTDDRQVEEIFFTKLRQMGISIKVETN